MSVAGLILSAGESRRMGSPKALLLYRGQTFLDGLIERFAEVCAPVIVVLGHAEAEIRAGISLGNRAAFVSNQDYRRGQLSSMQCGLRAMRQDTEGALFTLVDHPRVQLETLRLLLTEPRGRIVKPRYEGRSGHPVYFASSLFPEFLSLPPDGQARDVVRAHDAQTRFVNVPDQGILDDIDDPEAYQRLLAAT